ncbi:spore coat protein U [Aureimonas sp. SA4125]|uniref:Csu type fimbrial protein n=1 Tax=Aureimonas sp. SA4125 TaxID=2826993 RepID=UPI001CC70BE6|nr:spore coat U domain-containing protein [Aureimonas sp. SA4125]BDA85919.1 spore coat protein U [Aureimonas sp. SA4125]
MENFRRTAFAVAAASSLFAGNALAATATDDLGVTMTVTSECTLTANPLDFGSTGLITANIDVTTTLDIQCSAGTGYTISMDAGAGTGATTGVRVMTSGSDTATYGIYKDSGYADVFGSTGGEELTGTASGAAQNITIYGRVPPQNAAAGSYTDTVTVTLTY